MIKPTLTILSILAYFFIGCAKLVVTVSVIDKSVIEENIKDDLISNSMKQLSIQDNQSIESMFVDIQNKHFKAYAIRIDTLRKKKKEETDPTKKDLFEKKIEHLNETYYNTVVPEYKRLQKKWEIAVHSIQNLHEKYNQENDEAHKKNYKDSLVAAIESLKGQKTYLREYLLKDLDQFEQEESEADKRIASQANSEITKLFDSGGLIHSDYAYYLASAPEEEWGDPYDQSFGKGYFGNVDVAIKAIDQGNFTVKGLSFNPSDVTAMAAKITTQSVILAAQIAGVPVNIQGAPQGSGAALADSSARIYAAKANQLQLAIQFKSQRNALLKIAQSILDEENMISNGSYEQRKKSVDTITAIYNAQAGRLNIVVPNGGTKK